MAISLHIMLPFELTKDTPYLALSGELWSVFYEYFNRNWPCYKGFLLRSSWEDTLYDLWRRIPYKIEAETKWTTFCRRFHWMQALVG